MKILSISYHSISAQYGISENPAGVFSTDDNAANYSEDDLENGIRGYLEERNLTKRKVGLNTNGENTCQTSFLVELIQEINPKAEVIK
jgi:hypothetical protein